MEKIMIDAMGKQCPIPVVMMKKALDEQPQVSCAEILVDNEIAVKNLAKIANSQNCSFQWKKLEEKKLPADIDYMKIEGLRIEAREILNKIRPENLGQAGRIYGVNPADVAVLMVYLKK